MGMVWMKANGEMGPTLFLNPPDLFPLILWDQFNLVARQLRPAVDSSVATFNPTMPEEPFCGL
jgi:hypothetical protein